MYALHGVVVRKYSRTYLVYYVLLMYMHGKPEYTPIKRAKCVMRIKMHECNSCKQECTSVACANKDTCTLFVQTMMHTAAD